jgi:hypothetical protein
MAKSEGYTLINHYTGEEHELTFENVADIKGALRDIQNFNHNRGPKPKKIRTWECFEDTREKMDKVRIPATDY